ncbi:MAG TPA: dockerin type I repeat-containing protein, partial [candidate division Zixibacteria bacterium]
NLASGWVSVAAAPSSDIVFDYHYSFKPDLAVSNWEAANIIFKNIAPAYVAGDVNRSGEVEVGDIVFLINYLYRADSPPNITQGGDPNNDCIIDVADVIYLINYLYKGGPAPLEGCA